MQTDVSVQYAVVKMSSSIILSTSVVHVPLTCAPTTHSTSLAACPSPATPTFQRPVSALLITNVSTPQSVLRRPPDPLRYITQIHRIDRIDPTQHDRVPPRQRGDLGTPTGPPPVDDDNIAQYWFNALTSSYEVHLSNVETQHFTLTVTLKDSSVPKTFWQAMSDPLGRRYRQGTHKVRI